MCNLVSAFPFIRAWDCLGYVGFGGKLALHSIFVSWMFKMGLSFHLLVALLGLLLAFCGCVFTLRSRCEARRLAALQTNYANRHRLCNTQRPLLTKPRPRTVESINDCWPSRRSFYRDGVVFRASHRDQDCFRVRSARVAESHVMQNWAPAEDLEGR